MDKGLISGLNLIDYRKAFDLIDHATLLKKLAIYGVSGRSLQWFDSYLKDPKHKVTIQRQLSSPQSITPSVPQGSILSPLLCILFLNDLPLEVSRSTVEIYAPINVKPAGGAWHGVGIWHLSKLCSQIPCPRANHCSQMQPNFPTPGSTLLSVPRQNLRKAQ